MPKFHSNLDLNLNQLLGAIIEVLGADPSNDNTKAGRFWYNSADGRFKGQTGSGQKSVAFTDDPVGDADTLDGQEGAYYLARGNHTGTQTASTISDFDTQVRTSRLDQMAAPTSAVSLNNQRITSLANPQNDQDAATKAYVDAARAGLAPKDPVRAATTGAITLANEQTIDGVTLVAGDRVLVKDQTDPEDNGIYVVVDGGAWTRATDADSSGKVPPGMSVWVNEGTVNGDTQWVLTTDGPITLGTTELTFTQTSGAGQITAGDGLTKSGNTLNVGAGTGISVGADSVAIDTSVVPRKFAADIGDGLTTAIVVQHNLGTRDVIVQVYDASSFEQIIVDIERTDANNVTLTFTEAPAEDEFRVVIFG